MLRVERFRHWRSFVWMQLLLICIAVAVTSVLWATNIRPAITNILIYTFCLGNFSTVVIARFQVFYANREFPYNWLSYLFVLLLVTPIAFAIPASIIYVTIDRPSVNFWAYLQSGWKFPFIVNIIFGVVFYVYREMKETLETRNRELERVVEVESSERVSHDRELQRAREIQQALLPSVIPQVDGFEVAAAWFPARLVGGDYFDVIPLGKQRLGICIADVVGKSVSAALLMASVQATVRAFASDAPSPAQLCDRINKVLCSNIASDKFVTLLYGVLEGDTGHFEFCNAGHLEPVLVRGDGKSMVLRGGNLVLGVLPEAIYENANVEMGAGDRMVLFTDGITEAEQLEEEFGERRIIEIAVGHAKRGAEEMKDILMKHVDDFCGSQLRDDATLVVIAAMETAAVVGRTSQRKASGSDA
jgi:phosphoserine phosphatase RsbU/P